MALGPDDRPASPSGCWRDRSPGPSCARARSCCGLAERYTAERLDAACARALGFDLVDVRRLERILVLALEHEGQPSPPADAARAATAGRPLRSTRQRLRSSLRRHARTRPQP